MTGPAGRVARATEARATEADRTHGEIRELLNRELTALHAVGERQWLWVRDLTDTWVVWELEAGAQTGLFKADYSIDDDGNVTFGDVAEVQPHTEYVAEATIPGRVLSDRTSEVGTGDGHRIFRVQLIEHGESLNGRHYPESVLTAAAPLYEGAKAYDHHRTDEEMQTSTVQGLIGSYRDVTVNETGLEADLHLLPSAALAAEAFDASLDGMAAGLPPLVGISHDVIAHWILAGSGAESRQEATQIVRVLSADVVADPAAGGRPIRMVAGGITNTNVPGGQTMTLKELLAALRDATPEKRAELLSEHAAILTDNGLSTEDVTTMLGDGGSSEPDPAAAAADADADAGAPAGAAAEAILIGRESLMGRMLIESAAAAANLDERLTEAVKGRRPARFSEADLTAQIEVIDSVRESYEKAGIKESSITGVLKVGDEAIDKKVKRMDAMFAGDWKEGYHSLRQAFMDIDGHGLDPLSADLAGIILRESHQFAVEGGRARESLETTSWGQILGDSITRRMLALYSAPGLQEWRQLVSTVPVNDFRTQRRVRVGGYGTLPEVGQGAPYQSLPSPEDEEVSYAVTKKGGTEDLTMETIANDDLGATRQIPQRLARAAAITLYRFVFDTLIKDNPTIYDSVALFHASHANTGSAALTQSALQAGEAAMMKQASYGDTVDVLGLRAKFLLVPTDLSHLAFQLCTSAVALPGTTPGASDIPNPMTGLTPITVPHWTDADDWFLVANPDDTPTIELGFFGGREEPELFVQDDPKSGSGFSSDKVTYKIRHIYKGANTDYRGFFRGQGS